MICKRTDCFLNVFHLQFTTINEENHWPIKKTKYHDRFYLAFIIFLNTLAPEVHETLIHT